MVVLHDHEWPILLPCEYLDHFILEGDFSKASHQGGWLAQGLDEGKWLAAVLEYDRAGSEPRALLGELVAQGMVALMPAAWFDCWGMLSRSPFMEHVS